MTPAAETSPETLASRIAERLDAAVAPAVCTFAQALAEDAGADAVLFYGSNLRTGSLEGVLDFYVLMPGEDDARIWPRISYHEREHAGADERETFRAKVATMGLETFAKAASGELIDTTIWARFVQPCALVWQRNDKVRKNVTSAIEGAAVTAARLAAALGPQSGTAEAYWRSLFQATYKAEFRVEKPGRENDILSVNESHFAGLLPLALKAGGISFAADGDRFSPNLAERERKRILSWWKRRQRLGKVLNFARLAKASTTFEGAARYAAWKIERHTGMSIEVTPFRERYPLLAAPGVLWALRKHRKGRQ